MLQKLLNLSPIFKYKISGNSMLPTLKPGTDVLVNRFSELKTRDIIALKDPRDKKIIIKRLAKIEKGKFYVLGDNPKQSTDSRHFGWIQRHDIIGKVVYKLKVQS